MGGNQRFYLSNVFFGGIILAFYFLSQKNVSVTAWPFTVAVCSVNSLDLASLELGHGAAHNTTSKFFYLEISTHSISPNVPINVSIKSDSETRISGLLLFAEDSNGNRLGSFSNFPNGFSESTRVDCPGSKTVSHTTASPKPMPTFLWSFSSAESQGVSRVNFRALVVKSRGFSHYEVPPYVSAAPNQLLNCAKDSDCNAGKQSCEIAKCNLNVKLCEYEVAPAGTICRPKDNICDVEEVCDGVSYTCDFDHGSCPDPVSEMFGDQFDETSLKTDAWIVLFLSLGSFALNLYFQLWKLFPNISYFERKNAVRNGILVDCAFHLSIADSIAAAGFFAGSIAVITSHDISHIINDVKDPNAECRIEGFMISTFDLASILWTASISIQIFLLIDGVRIDKLQKVRSLDHIMCWGIPIIFSFLHLVEIGGLKFTRVGVWCQNQYEQFEDPLITFYSIFFIVHIIVVVSYVISKDILINTVRQTLQGTGSLSKSEMSRIQGVVKRVHKLKQYPSFFHIVAIPCYLWFVLSMLQPHYQLRVIMLLHAIFRPLRGVANAIVNLRNTASKKKSFFKSLFSCLCFLSNRNRKEEESDSRRGSETMSVSGSSYNTSAKDGSKRTSLSGGLGSRGVSQDDISTDKVRPSSSEAKVTDVEEIELRTLDGTVILSSKNIAQNSSVIPSIVPNSKEKDTNDRINNNRTSTDCDTDKNVVDKDVGKNIIKRVISGEKINVPIVNISNVEPDRKLIHSHDRISMSGADKLLTIDSTSSSPRYLKAVTKGSSKHGVTTATMSSIPTSKTYHNMQRLLRFDGGMQEGIRRKKSFKEFFVEILWKLILFGGSLALFFVFCAGISYLTLFGYTSVNEASDMKQELIHSWVNDSLNSFLEEIYVVPDINEYRQKNPNSFLFNLDTTVAPSGTISNSTSSSSSLSAALPGHLLEWSMKIVQMYAPMIFKEPEFYGINTILPDMSYLMLFKDFSIEHLCLRIFDNNSTVKSSTGMSEYQCCVPWNTSFWDVGNECRDPVTGVWNAFSYHHNNYYNPGYSIQYGRYRRKPTVQKYVDFHGIRGENPFSNGQEIVCPTASRQKCPQTFLSASTWTHWTKEPDLINSLTNETSPFLTFHQLFVNVSYIERFFSSLGTDVRGEFHALTGDGMFIVSTNPQINAKLKNDEHVSLFKLDRNKFISSDIQVPELWDSGENDDKSFFSRKHSQNPKFRLTLIKPSEKDLSRWRVLAIVSDDDYLNETQDLTDIELFITNITVILVVLGMWQIWFLLGF